MFQVTVNRLKFFGYHGVFSEEKTLGNEFEAWIIASVDGVADATDNLKDTVDYALLANLMAKINEKNSFDTIECLAGAFANEALICFPSMSEIKVTINKLNPKGMPDVESCGVTISQSR